MPVCMLNEDWRPEMVVEARRLRDADRALLDALRSRVEVATGYRPSRTEAEAADGYRLLGRADKLDAAYERLVRRSAAVSGTDAETAVARFFA